MSMSTKINLYKKTGFYANQPEKGAIFSNVYLIIIIFIISFLSIGYAIYVYYYNDSDNIISNNSSYYGKNVLLYEPLFEQQSNTIKDCINICNNDLTCDGITYNNDTQMCLGTKNGQIRSETQSYSAWVKSKKFSKQILHDFTKAILIGYTKTSRQVSGDKIQNPYMLGHYCYSFNLTIYDFYKNYGYWRHIFHKGTHIQDGSIITQQSWENLVKEMPNQVIGVWLAPFSNNLRIAVTTTSLGNRNSGSYPDAFVEKCNNSNNSNNSNNTDNTDNTDRNEMSCYITDMPSGRWNDTSKQGDGSTPKPKLNTYIEYFDNDLQNIPINTQINIIVNFRNTNAEVYINGKIVKITQLNGTPQYNKSNLYVLNDKTTNCEISNLLYYPDSVKLADVEKIISIIPILSE